MLIIFYQNESKKEISSSMFNENNKKNKKKLMVSAIWKSLEQWFNQIQHKNRSQNHPILILIDVNVTLFKGVGYPY